jgi:hypothetical protein
MKTTNYSKADNKGVQVLFTQKNSNYLSLGCDCYDIQRNALSIKSREPAIYHPPCRAWSRMRAFSQVPVGERFLAIWSISRVRRYGGVVEQPAGSFLWRFLNLPLPGLKSDIFGGFSISVDQHWFGHQAKKNTWLYIKGCTLNDLPPYPMNLDCITHCLNSSSKTSKLKELAKNKRSYTPILFAEYLIKIVNIIKNQNHTP